MNPWRRRWISIPEIRAREKWKKAWKEKPDEMRQHLAKATSAASHKKRLRREKTFSELRMLFSEITCEIEITDLNRGLELYLNGKHKRRKCTDKEVKALRTMLCRYGFVKYNPETALWRLIVV